MSKLPPLPHRHDRDRCTDRWLARKYSGRHIIERVVIVPERNINRYYIKHNYTKQPGLWHNCVVKKDQPIKINRHWRQLK